MTAKLFGESASNNGSMVKNDSPARYSVDSALDSGMVAKILSKIFCQLL